MISIINAAIEIELIRFVLLFDKKATINTIAITVALKTDGGTPVISIKHRSPIMVKIERR